MDDRRRTISSEEQMIGEALMRVSNTLEAQRLTKSLDYQEKLRRRSNIRLILAIICLAVAFMMVVVGGALLFVLWRYADPVLDTVMPFLKKMFGDFGIIWDGLVESATYVPVMVEQLTRILESTCVMLEGISRIDLAGTMRYLTNILGTTAGMLSDLRGALGAMMPMLGNMGKALTNMLNGDLTAITGMLKGMGIDMDTVSAMVRNGMEMLGNLSASGNDLMGALSNMTGAMTEGIGNADLAGIATSTTELMNKVPGWIDGAGQVMEGALGELDPAQAQQIVGGMGDALQGMVEGMQGLAGLLGRLGGLFGG